MTIKVRIVAGDVDQADAAALAIGRVLTVTGESRPRPRRCGDGVSLYLDVELPPLAAVGGQPQREKGA